MIVLDIYYDADAKANHFSVKGVPYADKERLKSTVKGIKWHGDFKFWHCPVALWNYNDLRKFAPDLTLGRYARQWLDSTQQGLERLLHVKQLPDVEPGMLKYNWYWAFKHQRVDAYFHSVVRRSFDWSDAGTGKTLKFIINAFETTDLTSPGHHAIIVSPNSAKLNWRNEILDAQEKIGVKVPITVYGEITSAKNRLRLLSQWVAQGGWLIINWEALRLLVDYNKKREPGLLLEMLGKKIDFLGADEAHRGKNRDAKQALALARLAEESLVYMEGTATPITVKPDDLYMGVHRAFPAVFDSYWQFVDRYCQVEEEEIFIKGGKGETKTVKKIGEGFNQANLNEWHTIAASFSVRRRFEDVVDIPEKQYNVMPIELTIEQKKVYDQAAEDWLKSYDGEEFIPIANTISLITYLRQICLDPAIVGVEYMKRLPAKTEALLDILEGLDEKPLVVASKFVKYIDRLERIIKDRGFSYIRITGKETPEQRQKNVERFQAGDAQVALCGIDAAGVAITLTAASHMVFTDRDWTKALNDQMEGRIRRIGQRHPQLFKILTAEGTVEDQIERSVKVKTMFEDAYVNQTGMLTKNQLRELLLGR